MQLTRSLWRTCRRRPKRPGPSKDADPELRHRKYLLPQLNGGDHVKLFRVKNLNSPCLCHLPLLCRWCYCLWQLVLNKSLRLRLYRPENNIPPREWETSAAIYWWWVCDKKATLPLSMMHGGPGSQSQHIKTASIWLLTVCGYMFIFIGGTPWEKNRSHFYDMPLWGLQHRHVVWNDTLERHYAKALHEPTKGEPLLWS